MIVVCGHYGSGKTTFAMNLALDLRKTGVAVTLIDLDVVNPYFRTGDYKDILEAKGVKVVATGMQGTTVDVPALSAGISGALVQNGGHVIIDAGGDGAGATALGRFSREISAWGYDMLYVVNKYRPMTGTPPKAAELLRGIESASRLKATGIVNNSHLGPETAFADIQNSAGYADETARLLSLPLLLTTAPEDLNAGNGFYPIKIMVLPPWKEN